MHEMLVPDGLIAIEDIDYSGHFIYPPSAAFADHLDRYRRTALARGADPEIGPRLPGMLQAAGFAAVDMNVLQPAGQRGEVKLVHALTMAAIAEAAVRAGFATAGRAAQLADEPRRLAPDETTVMGFPRIVQAWGRKAPPR